MSYLSTAESALVRLAGAMATRGRKRRSLLVLTYHRVLRERDPLLPSEPTEVEFGAQLDMLVDAFNVIGLREARARLDSAKLPPRAVSITFDDGYANNCDVALPLLQARGLPATVFVATGFLDGGRMFNDTVIEAVRRAGPELDLSSVGLGRYSLPDVAARRRAIDQILPAIKHLIPDERRAKAECIAEAVGAQLPGNLMMTEAQARRLADHGIELGAHTVNHPILTSVPSEVARTEIRQSRQRLEEITGRPVRCFAYPNGRPDADYDASHVAMVREAGFELAVSTAHGAAGPGADRHQLPRVALWGGPGLNSALRLVANYRERGFRTVAD